MIDPLVPVPARLLESADEGGGVRTLHFSWQDVGSLCPGMGFKVTVFGFGETDAWVSEIGENRVGLSVRDTDRVTHRILLIPPGQWLGLRGPHGNGFPKSGWPEGRVGLFSMDFGLVPQRALVNTLVAGDHDVLLAHLATDPGNVVLGSSLERAAAGGERVEVVRASLGREGVKQLAEVLDGAFLARGHLSALKSAAVAGPSAFLRLVVERLQKTQIRDRDIHVLVNRNRTSGAGFSNQDLLGRVNIWQRGPVFSLDKLRDLSNDAL
ncbi:hypothetical protein IIA16_04645 [bacterium]|nr:hypothetical protein [bacterium]